ncbi:Metallo-dependent phosphatase-like protein [Radiomyces spectabilis]|uniref:Metallo-dependent phosphatase-like protein n=1 Tax=Radiomyces spectabilis TaxID=64574 RepID=UPI00221F4D5F|nr:Metallo-dependent phosphatase-like protein [Radiomyces spectabilis]KAI8388837.1 Metallo-dependent phosphatase-like protein [Radiomyces spectabilis]
MPILDLIHFNDVYNVSPAKEEPIGGAARFRSAVDSVIEAVNPLVLFSGDAFNPSLEGSVTRGMHMTNVLKLLNINAACIGNHDFDFGLPQLQKLLGNTNFPWLLSNVLDETGEPPSPLQRHLILEHPSSGLRIGVIGLVEEEWIQTIPSFPPELVYHDFVNVGHQLAKMLKDPEGSYKVDLVIALTHMRVPNDIKLGQACSTEIDLILGGHDHFYYVSQGLDIVGKHWTREENLKDVGFDPEKGQTPTERPVRVVKSGTDFREFSHIHLEVETDDNGRKYISHASVERKIVDSTVSPNKDMEQVVDDVAKLVSQKTQRPIGYTAVPLDGRSQAVRTRETNLGNLTADLMLISYRFLNTPPDFALCCGGTIRNDSIIEVGELTLGDIMTAFPFQDPVVVVKLTGQQIWDALENSVSEYPKQEGRFPQLAGLRLEWNPNKPPGQRVRRVLCVRGHQIGDPSAMRPRLLPRDSELRARYDPDNMDPLDLEREYVVSTRNYLTGGYDGYTSLMVSPDKYVIDDENGVLVTTLYRKFFLGLKYFNAFRESLINRKKRMEDKKKHDNERIQRVVAAAANHWLKMASQLQPEEDDDEKSHYRGSFSSDKVEDRAEYNCTDDCMINALHDANQGHPSCIAAEDDEDKDPEPGKRYPNDEGESWLKRWASISPSVQGRIVQVDY